MSGRIAALNRILVRFETVAVGVLATAVCMVVLVQVLMRYVVVLPNPWSEEVSRFAFLWMSLLGASLAVEHRAHFRFDRVVRGLPDAWRRGIEGGARFVTLGFALLLIGAGIALMELTWSERSAALGLPIAGVYAAAPASGVFMVIHLLAGRAGEGGRGERGAGSG